MTRADALRVLIQRVEAGVALIWSRDWRAFVGAQLGETWGSLFDAAEGSLDAVASLEAPLRERGWDGPDITAPSIGRPSWWASWMLPDAGAAERGDPHLHVEAPASTEPRARLLALLRVHLHEAETEPLPSPPETTR